MHTGWSPDHTRKSAGLMVSAFLGLIAFLILPITAYSAPANRRAVAVIIGNTDYSSRIPRVEFAGNDADAFRKFVVDVLGYDPENIIDLRNATKAQMETAFGNDRSPEGKLWRYLDPKGRSDVTVFYSGHGVPGLKDKRGYLLPVDADAETPEINGYSLDTLLGNLGKLETKSVSVFLDACFSGDSQKGMLIQGASGITIAPKMPDSSSAMTIISAAQGDQVASWDFKAKHGLFTKHLLDGLYGEADRNEYGNGDGQVALSEVSEYLDDTMTRAARRSYGRHQNAWARGDGDEILVKEIPSERKKPEIVASLKPETVVVVTNPTPQPKPATKTITHSLKLVPLKAGDQVRYNNRTVTFVRKDRVITVIKDDEGYEEKLLFGVFPLDKVISQRREEKNDSLFKYPADRDLLNKAKAFLPFRVGQKLETEINIENARENIWRGKVWFTIWVLAKKNKSKSGHKGEIFDIKLEVTQIRRSGERYYTFIQNIEFSPALGLAVSVDEKIDYSIFAKWKYKFLTLGSFHLLAGNSPVASE
ncbi:MAG: caspase family protein [Alphaproteobacteria bacterium]|nr:caspase family protein [Alphaproteobacteria bacterium]MBT4084433.1 caspase family protein [Alphaproteobacteria bacterium]MBT4545656.1 caspase family protein [Alphaproteobacteria bacterium]MBT7748112.1 caspase family protein [Alphaproteobacteria bacterium]